MYEEIETSLFIRHFLTFVVGAAVMLPTATSDLDTRIVIDFNRVAEPERSDDLLAWRFLVTENPAEQCAIDSLFPGPRRLTSCSLDLVAEDANNVASVQQLTVGLMDLGRQICNAFRHQTADPIAGTSIGLGPKRLGPGVPGLHAQ
jgi:hypothetical protein